MWAVFSLVVLWFGAIAAYAYTDGMNLFDFMGQLAEAINRPFAFHWTPHTPKFMLGARQNRRPGEEHGSAAWGNARTLNRKYRDKKPENNVILTKHLQMGLDGRKHQRNLLQIVVGGSGSGKTRFVVKPNILLANTSYIATDPKGELLRSTGAMLLKQGYTLRVIDLVDPANSDYYNPFAYIGRSPKRHWTRL